MSYEDNTCDRCGRDLSAGASGVDRETLCLPCSRSAGHLHGTHVKDDFVDQIEGIESCPECGYRGTGSHRCTFDLEGNRNYSDDDDGTVPW